MTLAPLCLAGFAAAALGTGLVRRYALRRNILDVPNARSSHAVPTPRGGGVAIVGAFLPLLFLARGALSVSPRLAMAMGIAGGSMALLGFLDDHGHIPAGWRLLGHFLASGWALAWLGGAWIPDFFGASFALQVLGYVISSVGLVWLLNLYNFMDGIDGIASLESITVCVPAALICAAVAPGGPWPLALLLAACTAGFLVWNFPPARIFMGDAGSNFLGMGIGVLAMASAASSPKLLLVWGILLGTFVVDATVTLLRRLQRRERAHEAHRSHAYQYASRRYGAHRPVSIATAAINLAWLTPMAAAVAFGWIGPLAGVAVAYVPLVALSLCFKAGAREQQEV